MKPLLLILVTLSASLVCAQKPLKDVYLKRTLKQDGIQLEFTVLDPDEHGIWIYSKKKYYFWYKAQGVKSTQGESSGTLLHGNFESFFPNDQLNAKGTFRKGLKQGEWMTWRENGSLITVEKWSNGDLKSKKWYNEAGTIYKVERSFGRNWEKEKADTVIVKRKLWKREMRVFRDSDGRMVRSEQLKSGLFHGNVVYYSQGKFERSEKYKKGELIASSDDVKPEKETKEKKDKAVKSDKVKEPKPEKIKEPKPSKEKKEKVDNGDV